LKLDNGELALAVPRRGDAVAIKMFDRPLLSIGPMLDRIWDRQRVTGLRASRVAALGSGAYELHVGSDISERTQLRRPPSW
jgi:hypothetical protein